MKQDNFVSIVAKGNKALSNGDEQLALVCFERALQLERNPLTCSSLAYCLAKVRGSYQEAISLAREALDSEPDNPLHHMNYGRVLFLAGNKEQALSTLRKGLDYGMHIEILRELESIGIKNPQKSNKSLRNDFLKGLRGLFFQNWLCC